MATYYYDPFGRRLWKKVAGVKTHFMYADEGLIAEFDASGSMPKSYGYAPNSTWTTNPLFMKQGTQYYFYHNDHLGTPQKMTAVNGSTVWSAKHESFGKVEVDPASTVENNLRFPGQYYDQESGLRYNWHRYYDPKSGRYLSHDPIGFFGGDLDLYACVLNNPINYFDPFGLWSWKGFGRGATQGIMAVGIGIGIGVGIAAVGVLFPPAAPFVLLSLKGMALAGALSMGWQTGQAITGDRINISSTGIEIRTMCDEERSELWGQLAVEALFMSTIKPKGIPPETQRIGFDLPGSRNIIHYGNNPDFGGWHVGVGWYGKDITKFHFYKTHMYVPPYGEIHYSTIFKTIFK